MEKAAPNQALEATAVPGAWCAPAEAAALILQGAPVAVAALRTRVAPGALGALAASAAEAALAALGLDRS